MFFNGKQDFIYLNILSYIFGSVWMDQGKQALESFYLASDDIIDQKIVYIIINAITKRIVNTTDLISYVFNS